jgi:peptide methionine sulfoxide reductase msrA/msrB
MKYTYYSFFLLLVTSCNAQIGSENMTNQEKPNTIEYNKLTEAEKRIILQKGTEYPNTGEYNKHYEDGTYICRQCNQQLYKSSSKFNSNCGWPSFDDEIDGAVNRILDSDGRRTEIVCSNCTGHLGHVFIGENFTAKNTRHCVNSISMKFIPKEQSIPEIITSKEVTELDTITFGAGCFWCVEVLFQKLKGVSHVESGYAGGKIKNPTYKMVCQGNTGSVEVAQLVYDPKIISTETLIDIFFHVHDPTTLYRQGNDVGEQYRSVIFYHSTQQKEIAKNVLKRIDSSKLWNEPIVTTIESIYNYSTAEDYHQNYYNNNSSTNGYCNMVIRPKVKKFKIKYADLIK